MIRVALRRVFLPLVLVALVLLALAAQPAAAAPRDGLARALARGQIDEAQHSLYRALALFRPAQVEARFGRVAKAGGRDATGLLLDLARRTDRLAGAERRLAERLLARPTDRRDPIKRYRAPARYRCDKTICVFWVNRTADAPPLRDRRPRNGVPDQVDLARATLRQVWRAEIGSMRYPRPLGDLTSRNHGPNGKLDVYLADIGSRGLYGYCTTDDPRRNRRANVSAYCVLDDDYSPRQFPTGANGKAALQVTAAHEFLHASQLGVDYLEDFWILESTATWIEDEVYPLVNDNVLYLPVSPAGSSSFVLPLDVDEPDNSQAASAHKYGAWIFWRYLSERFGRDVVRDAVTGFRGAPYGLQATEAVLAARGQAFADVFHAFALANYFLASSYSEGALYAAQPGVGPQAFPLALSPGVAGSVPLAHLSSDYYLLTGAGGFSSVTVTTTFPPPETGSRATAIVQRTTGNDPAVPLTSGVPVALATGPTATGILIVFSNGSTRVASCFTDNLPPFSSCYGVPVDAGGTFAIDALGSP